MEREAFEKLVSDWLDEPQRPDLRAVVQAALRESPELAELRTQYAALDALLRELPAPRVDWDRLRTRIAEAVTAQEQLWPGDSWIDQRLRALVPSPAARVDWPTYKRRISAAVHARARRRRVIRLVPWGGLAAGLAAAALLLLWFAPPYRYQPAELDATAAEPHLVSAAPHRSTAAPVVQARLEIHFPARDKGAPARPVLARAVVVEEPAAPVDSGAGAALALAPAHSPVVHSEPEVYFLLEPPEAGAALVSRYGSGK